MMSETTPMPTDSPAANTIIWATFRLAVGWWPVMIMAGVVHSEIWTSFPPWAWRQSFVVSVFLTLLAWFFRR